ncbi:MAG: HEAT repeat domain-containing protein [Actinomycetes bacterium]
MTERTRAVTEVVRSLGMALSASRLFPGDTQQTGFATAHQRLVDAFAVARRTGAVAAEVRHGVLLVDGTEVADGGGSIDRLAAACFDRSVEYLEVVAVPTPDELMSATVALSETVDELADAGGVEASLARRHVRSIVLAPVKPEGVDDPGLLAGLDPALRGMIDQVRDPARFIANLLVAGSDATGSAEAALRQFQVVYGGMDRDLRARSGFYRDVHRIIEELPDHVARELLARIVTRTQHDPFSRELLGQLTDGELVGVVRRLSSGGGPDAVDLARRLTQILGDREGIVGLVELELGDADADPDLDAVVGAGLRRSGMALSRAAEDTRIRDTLADAAAAALLDASSRDSAELRDGWPVTLEQLTVVALDALRDYLRVERDLDALGAVLQRWVVELRTRLTAGDAAGVDRLDRLVAEVEVDAAGDPPRAARFAEARAGIVDDEVVAALLDPAADEVEQQRARRLLARFEVSALRSALDRLAVEERPGVRAQLVALASELASGHVSEVTDRTGDPRWYVVRNLVTILGRTPDPQAVTALVALVRHPEPQVRRELVRALVSAAGSDAVTHVRALAGDRDPDVRRAAIDALAGLATVGAAHALADVVRRGEDADARRAIDMLASHPSAAAGELLAELGSRRAAARLSSHLRRAAKRAAKEHRPS